MGIDRSCAAVRVDCSFLFTPDRLQYHYIFAANNFRVEYTLPDRRYYSFLSNLCDQLLSCDPAIENVEFEYVRSYPALQINLYAGVNALEVYVQEGPEVQVLKDLIHQWKDEIQEMQTALYGSTAIGFSLIFMLEGPETDFCYDYSYSHDSWSFQNHSKVYGAFSG